MQKRCARDWRWCGFRCNRCLNEADRSQLIAARNESPLVLGLGDGENFIASDVPAILPYTRRMVFLEDGDMAVVSDSAVQITALSGAAVQRAPRVITWDPIRMKLRASWRQAWAGVRCYKTPTGRCC